MVEHTATDPRFACDAMLGGLARWLRAAGYDASWQPHITDHELLRLAREEQRVLLSADCDLFQFRLVRDGAVASWQVPNDLKPAEQLALVLRHFGLGLRAPRCMACGGSLQEITKDQAQSKVPPRSFAWLEHFWECLRCGKVFWHGTHWQNILQRLGQCLKKDAE